MNIPAYVRVSRVPVRIIGFVTDEMSAIAICVHYDGSINEYRIDKLEVLSSEYRPATESISEYLEILDDCSTCLFNSKCENQGKCKERE